MKTLISPLQTLRLAFGDGDTLPPETIAETDIAAAEARWIVPAIGRDLHEKLLRGAHPDFCADYLAAPTRSDSITKRPASAKYSSLSFCGFFSSFSSCGSSIT